ncbi:hypothetical protein AB4144_34675, partial [Rhizobiaceae sp. 2RAB30]
MGAYPKVIALSDGRFVVAWQSEDLDSSQPNEARWQMFDASGNKIGGIRTAGTTSQGSQSEVSIVATADGGYVVSWISENQATGRLIQAQKYDANGNAQSNETNITSLTTASLDSPKVFALPDGGYAVTWQGGLTEGGNGAFLQIVGRNGEKIGSAIRVGTEAGNQGEPTISVMSNGDVLVTWVSSPSNDSSVFSLRFAHDTEKVAFKGSASVISALTAADLTSLAE